MFSFECMQHQGKSIGICIERYYVGSCCYFNTSSINEQQTHKETTPINQQTDHLISTNLTSQQNDSNKLRMVNKPNITYIKEQVTKLFQVGSKRLTNNDANKVSNYQKEKISSNLNSSNSNDLKIIEFSTNQTISDEENDSTNLINSTLINSTTIKLPTSIKDKLNYTEQIKPINLIENFNKTTISIDANYLLSNSSNNLTQATSNIQLTTPMPLNNSVDLLDDTSSTQISSLLDNHKLNYTELVTTTTEETNSETYLTSSAQTSNIEKYFMNLGLFIKYYRF